jgi:clan AA aspartic protease
MGTIYTEITLKNPSDDVCLRHGLITEQDVRTVTVTAIVDTGAGTLVISEEICKKLGLLIKGERSARVANGVQVACKVTEPVEIRWKTRLTACPAVVMPGAETILLGAIPLEDMDLIVHPAKQELTGAHGDEVVTLAL